MAATSCISIPAPRPGGLDVAERLRTGDLVTDPDGALGLHEEQVRVAAPPRPIEGLAWNHRLVVVDWEIPGTNRTGAFTARRWQTVHVVGGAR